MAGRVLLDTNVLIHREAASVVLPQIGLLFNWLDKLGFQKCVHPLSAAEISKHKDERVRTAFAAKLASYHQLQSIAPLTSQVSSLVAEASSVNDEIDLRILNELASGRVDFLITEDRKLGETASRLGLSSSVFTIDAFLEKVNSENPDLANYKVLAVRRTLFGDLDIRDGFFDSFREDYDGAAFDTWFAKKSDETAYVCFEEDKLVAFLYLKVEGTSENYYNIEPVLRPTRRLKIGTLKVELNGFKLGERFLKIIFDNAVALSVDEIYVTIFDRTVEQQRLISLLKEFGFESHGLKKNSYGTELVFVRSMERISDPERPRRTFPYFSRSRRTWIVPIYPEYHTELLPDSILNNESPQDFVESEPHRNAIRKVYISRSINRSLESGDTVVFYRTGGYYQSVVTTIGIVEDLYTDIPSEAEFIRLCRKRSVFTDEQLAKHWNYNTNRPFIVGFLYAYSFPRRPNMKELIANGVIADVSSAPRGFEPLTKEKLDTVLRLARADARFIVD